MFVQCKKDEGQGGTSSIKGRIIEHDFRADFLDSVPVAILPDDNENIFIIYGTDHTTYDDSYKTSYDGTYEFRFLQKGHYRLFAYSNDSTGAHEFLPTHGNVPVFVDVDITENGTTVTGPDIILLKNNR